MSRRLYMTVATCLLLVQLSPAIAADYLIKEILFAGNDKTVESTFLQELTFKVGDRVSDEQIEESRQNIMNIGLYKSVKAEVDDTADGQSVTFTVDEKRYWFVVPSLSRSGDGDISYGGEVQIDNLRGRNHHLEVKLRQKELKNTDIDNEQLFEVEFRGPHILGSPFELNIDAKIETAEISEERIVGDSLLEGEFERDLLSLDLRVSRWFKSKGPSKGWRLTGGILYEDYDHTFINGEESLFFDVKTFSLVGSVDYRDVNNYEFSRSGKHYGYRTELAADALGSERSFARHGLFYRQYNRITKREHTNLNFQLRAGYATRSLFGDATFNAAGSRLVRGYDRDSIEGESYFIGNVELFTPVFKKRALRLGGSFDFGNAYPTVKDFDPTDLEYGVGLGMRWRIRSFVKTDLRLDVNRGLGDLGETKVYAGTKGVF